MIIREKTLDSIIGYKLDVDATNLLQIQRKELEKLREHISYLQLVSSWGNEKKFVNFITQDVHKYCDFYFDHSVVNSIATDYMSIEKLNDWYFKDKKTVAIEQPFDHTFKIFGDIDKNEGIYKDSKIETGREAHYAIFDINDVTYGGGHASIGYHNDSVIQIPKIVYLIDKILKQKVSMISREFANSEFDEILSLVTVKEKMTLPLENIKIQFDDDNDYEDHIKQMVISEPLVYALKRIGSIKR